MLCISEGSDGVDRALPLGEWSFVFEFLEEFGLNLRTVKIIHKSA